MNTDETKTENELATEPHGKHGMEEEDLTFKIRGCVYFTHPKAEIRRFVL